MSKLFNQINVIVSYHDRTTSLVLKNTRDLFEGFSDSSLSTLMESATSFLDSVIKQLQSKSITNQEEVIDMLTGLRVLGTATQRERLHIKLPTVKVLVLNAGDSTKANQTIMKLGQNPQQKETRDKIQKLIAAALDGEPDHSKRALQVINNMKSTYAHVQQSLEKETSDQPVPSAAPKKTNV